MSKNRVLIGDDGEVGDLDDSFFATARRGRPALLPGEKNVRMKLMIDADIAPKLNAVGNKSAFVTEALRKALAG